MMNTKDETQEMKHYLWCEEPGWRLGIEPLPKGFVRISLEIQNAMTHGTLASFRVQDLRNLLLTVQKPSPTEVETPEKRP